MTGKSLKNSFTLIEVLAVIAIIAILSSMVFFLVITPIQQRTRDAQRMSDLRQIQKGLELYYSDHNQYPKHTQNYEIEGALWGEPWNPYLPIVPKDPLKTKTYAYYSEDNSSFQIYAQFEREDEIDPTFSCGSCGPDGEFNAGISSSNELLLAFDSGKGDTGGGGIVTLPQGKQTYTIQGTHNSPNFIEAVIDPVDVKPGDNQEMTVKITDTYPINQVLAKIETDTGIKTYELSLIEGTNINGTWQGEWQVYDTHSAKYRTTFLATNSNNESNSVTLTWTDPCTPGPSGDWSLDANCSISNTTGVDNGSFTVTGGYTLTLQPGSTFVFNSGKAIYFVNGSIAKGVGAQIKKTNLWMVDADSDGYSPATTQYAQDSAPDNGRRRYLLNAYSSIDYNDSSNSVYPGTACNGACSINSSGGTCDAVSAGENSQTACKRCNGSDLTPVNIADLSDAEGSNTCAGTCAAYCSAGSCINTDTSTGTCTVATNARVASGGDGHCSSSTCTTDIKANGEACTLGSECSSGNCIDGYCCDTTCTGTCKACDVAGSLGTCSNIPVDTDPDTECSAVTCTDYIYGWSSNDCLKYSGSSSHNGMCNGSAACYTTVADSCSGAGSTSASCGSSGCKMACVANAAATSYDTAAECCYTSGQNSCSACYGCNASGTCTAQTTGWNAGTFSCTGASNRCYSGSCVTCGGYIASDNCSGCAGQGGNACWYLGTAQYACYTTSTSTGSVCTNGCVSANWNDSTSCSVLAHWYPSQCASTSTPCAVGGYTHSPEFVNNTYCIYRSGAYSQDCASYNTGNWVRLCVCNY